MNPLVTDPGHRLNQKEVITKDPSQSVISSFLTFSFKAGQKLKGSEFLYDISRIVKTPPMLVQHEEC